MPSEEEAEGWTTIRLELVRAISPRWDLPMGTEAEEEGGIINHTGIVFYSTPSASRTLHSPAYLPSSPSDPLTHYTKSPYPHSSLHFDLSRPVSSSAPPPHILLDILANSAVLFHHPSKQQASAMAKSEIRAREIALAAEKQRLGIREDP